MQIQSIENFKKLWMRQTQGSMLAENKVLDNLKQKLKNTRMTENLKAERLQRTPRGSKEIKKKSIESKRWFTINRGEKEAQEKKLELEQLEEKFNQDYGTDDRKQAITTVVHYCQP